MAQISLCMIVKDEQEVLARCLDSIRPLVDEIVIVDTGSADATVDLALRHGATVYEFDWNDDFAEARNFSFSKATSPYILWLDADDVVLPAELDKLLRLKASLHKDVYYLRYDYAQDESGNSLCTLYRERLVRNHAAIRWHHPVHECLLITPEMSSEITDIVITHRRTEAGARSDENRNLRILERVIKQECYAEDPRLRYYLGKEYQDAGMDAEAIAAYHQFLEMAGGWVEDRSSAQQRVAQCYYNLSKKEPGRQSHYGALARAAAKAARLMDNRWAEPYFLLGQIAFDEDDFEEAAFWYEKALRPQPPVLSPVSACCYGLGPLVQLCLCYDRLGKYELAWAYNERALELRPADAGLLYNRRYLGERLTARRPPDRPVKLNLGSGNKRYQDYISCDRFPGKEVDEVFSLDRIPYPDNSVLAIHSEHALEHLYHDDARHALGEWLRVLQPGGEVILKVPDLGDCCRGFLQAQSQHERDWFRQTIYGAQRTQGDEPLEGQIHYTGFTEDELVAAMRAAGFIIDCHYKYDGYGTPSIAVRALKPIHAKRIGWVSGSLDIKNPQYRIRIYHIDRWLRSRGYRSELIAAAPSADFDSLIFFRRFTKQEYDLMSAARARGQQVIVDLCEDLFDLGVEWYRPMIALADQVVCCSHALAAKAALCNPRVEVIEDAVEADFNLNCSYDGTDALRVGWLGMGGNARHAEALRPIIESLGYKLVTIHEHNGADVAWDLSSWQQALAQCDIAIAPLDEKLQPAKSNNKITTYMALGLPTIASPLDAYLRIIEHGHNGFIAPSPTDWAIHLQNLSDANRRRRVGEAAKAAARHYHLDVIAEKWARLLTGRQSPPEPVIDIIIPTCGYSPYLRLCVESIAACTELPCRILVINSGSASGMDGLPGHVEIIQSEHALSYAQALNLGIRHARADYLCFLNDDVIVTSGWLEPLIEQVKAGAGLANPLSNCDRGWLHDYPLEVDGMPLLAGQNTLVEGRIRRKGIDEPGLRPERLHQYNPGKTRAYDREWLAFYCTVVAREVIDRVGLLDDAFVNGCEDLDYCKRAAAIGYRCAVNERSFVFHFGGVSRAQKEMALPEQYREEDRQNHARVSLKYERPILVIHTGQAYEPWTAQNINQSGIGGAETAASHMAEEMARLGYRVIVFTPCGASAGEYRGVEYLDVNRFAHFVETHHVEVFVASRYVNLFDLNIRAAKKGLWVHDVWAMGTALGDEDKVSRHYDELDAVFCLSPWHRDFFAETHGISKDKLIVVGNGIDPARFDREVEKQPYRFIYSSSPDRGLDTLLDLFPQIRSEFPQAELHIFYGFENWDKSIEQSGDAALKAVRERIYSVLNQPGVFFHGRVGQQRLAEEFLRSDVWFYPTRFTETYCITALEAQVAGAVCVCSDLAALRTTVADRGVLISGDAYTEDYRKRALQELRRLLRDDGRKRALTAKARAWALEQTWAARAKIWAEVFNPDEVSFRGLLT
jgi:glycosyltransferase involved in cell wall biosynthesis/SAM-dependent methyltransferase